ncbi:MAG TPA: aminotransferase class I/II-fold pyridoxal phosphate-dependent enzyme [Egibacteraceae bacterium]|nr:aminotransferase class I/II-fold pyridoxal phosphate-dependent enzyme [Egibacteraceae bacterium]
MTHAPPGHRPWLSPTAAAREQQLLADNRGRDLDAIAARLADRIDRNRTIHERECLNLNPATNVMNPAAEAALSAGLGSRPSLGHPGEKYEMGLEAIEEIEVIAADLACRVFDAAHAEVRVGSGALANLYAFMATCRPGDAIIVPSTAVGGHVTHHDDGAAGLYGLQVHSAPVDVSRYTVDVDALAELAREVRPRLITIGGSLNLSPHPVAAVRAIADEVGADVLFDAAHVCGLVAGGAWPNPLAEGADVMTMSTYKSLAGPPGGLVLTNRDDLAQRVDAIAYPGLTANFDAGKTAALALTLIDWLDCGAAYASAMVDAAAALAGELQGRGVPVVTTTAGPTSSHQLAFDARQWGGGHATALRLREANLLTSGIGIPGADGMAAVRLGTPEAVRWGMTAHDMPEVADLIVRALRDDPAAVAPDTTALRRRFSRVHFVRG